jgi:hypothetical protein
MGGYGSGRRGGGRVTEDGWKLDMSECMALGQLRPGADTAGSIQWINSHTRQVTAVIGYEADLLDADDAWMRLRCTTTRRDGTKHDNDYRIALTTRLFNAMGW